METEYVYALCRSYDPNPVMFKNERRIKLGLEPEPIVVELFTLFKSNRKEEVAKLELVERGNGIIIGMITDHFEQRPVTRTIPLDDLVKEENLAGPLKVD